MRTLGPGRASPAALVVAAALLSAFPPPGAAAVPANPVERVERVSVDSRDRPGTGGSYAPTVSTDGRYIAFDSSSSSLVPGDDNSANDVFVRDRRTGRTSRVSVSSRGREGAKGSFTPAISGDGRWVAFTSDADNLVPRDTNGDPDVFLHDRRAARTIRLSVALDGRQTGGGSSPSISRNGRFVVYNVAAPLRSIGTDEDLSGMFIYDTRTQRRARLPRAAGIDPSISGNGRFVAFSSQVRDLVPGDTNRVFDAFVLDRRTAAITRVSVGPKGRQGNDESLGAVISANGRFVAFSSTARNLVARDTNDVDDVFVHDRRTRETRRVSVRTDGRQLNGLSGAPVLSGDGRTLVYLSTARNLLPGGESPGGLDVYRADLRTGALTRVNSAAGGGPADGPTSSFPAISADGRHVAFGSRAANLTAPPRDTNGRDDIFVRSYDRGVRVSGGNSDHFFGRTD
ncbi:MAG: TolB family protein [Sporichthyaceae bacterium]